MPLRRTLAPLAVCLLTACSGAPPRPEAVAAGDYGAVIAHADRLIRHQMAAHGITGLSIALVHDQQLLWAEGFGQADREAGRPATAETLYRVGSITKLFTAAAALQLAEQGRLAIDRPLAEVLPEFAAAPPGTPPITPRLLMTHHSGLDRDYARGMFTARPEPYTALVSLVRPDEAPYPPGRVFAYSNIGFTLLGHAIERASGHPFAEHLQQSLLTPLGMTSANVRTGLSDSPLMAQPYRNGQRAEEPALRDLPAGGLTASVLDLSRFLAMVFAEGRGAAGQVLSPASVREMLRPQNADVPLDMGFHNGLGWMLATLGGSTIRGAGPVAHHAGATIHYRAQMYALPRQKLGVVVLANSGGAAAGAVDRIATTTLALALEAHSGIRQPRPDRPPAASWPADQLQPYVGDYTTQVGHVRLRLDGSSLQAEALGHRFALTPRTDGWLGLDYRLFGLIPVDLGPFATIGVTRRRVAGRDLLIARAGEQEMLLGERLGRPDGLAPWRRRLGRYATRNGDGDQRLIEQMELLDDQGLLIARLAGADPGEPPRRLVLKPLSEDDALLLGPLADGGSRLHCSGGAEREVCHLAGYALSRTDRQHD